MTAERDGRTDADVVVIGAGHNALVAAAYLATAGLDVLVLEGQDRPGGDTSTEEATLPGFLHDACSTAHTLIQSNPLLRDNELHLDRHGLRYLFPDPVFVVPFSDGDAITMWRDSERTETEIGRYSRADARAYRQLLDDWQHLKPLYAAERNSPPLTPEENAHLWRSGPLGDEGLRIRQAAGLDIIEERFEHPRVRTFIAWVATMTMEPIDHPLTGIMPFALTAGRQEHSWAIPEGGSGALPRALIEIVEERGGSVMCNAFVSRFLREGDRTVGVETADGQRFAARRAVLSSAHFTQLPDQLGEIDEETGQAVERWVSGLTMFVSHYAVSEPPRYRTSVGEVPSVAMGTLESIDNLHACLADFRRGRLHLDQPLTLCLSPSILDPTRTPDDRHTLKVIGVLPYALTGGVEGWDAVKEEVAESLLDTFLAQTANLTRDHILARSVESPLDLERRNPNNFRGSCHGGASVPGQTGWYRPAPRWNGYRTPIDGLYLTGSTTHPGGSVSAFPGRNAARVLLDDLGIGWETVLARAAEPVGRL